MAIEWIPAGDRQRWLDLRRQDVTASAAAALLDEHPWITRYGLWASKALSVDDPEETPPMRRGRLLEPVAVALMKEERPKWKIKHNSGAKQFYVRDSSIRLGATPDTIVEDRKAGTGTVQIKSVEASNFRKNWIAEDGVVEPPLWIVVQAIVEARLVGATWAAVAALTVGHGIDLHITEIPLHAGVFDRIVEETVDFWRKLEAGETPPPDYARDGEILGRIYREDDGTEADLSRDNRIGDLLDKRVELKASIAQATRDLEPVDAEIVHKIGSAERAYFPGWSISRRLVRRAGFFVPPSDYRQLRVQKKKGD